MPTLASCGFQADEYSDALREAERVARANREPVTRVRVRVRVPGPWWRNVNRVPQQRTDPFAMLGWLHAEGVTPTVTDADGGYEDFLSDLNWAQTLLAGSAELKEDHRLEAVEALRAVGDSPHRISLPSITLDAVNWYLNRLQR